MAAFEQSGPVQAGDAYAARGSMVYLLGACTVAAMGGLLFGFDTAVINGTIERLSLQFDLSPWMKGWVVSSALIGCLFGSAMAGALSDWLGRKRVLFLAALLFIASAIGCAMPQGASAVQQLILARVDRGHGDRDSLDALAALYRRDRAPAAARRSDCHVPVGHHRGSLGRIPFQLRAMVHGQESLGPLRGPTLAVDFRR